MSISFFDRAATGHSQRPANWSVTVPSIWTCASSSVTSATSASCGQSIWKATSSRTLVSDPSAVQSKVSIVGLSALGFRVVSSVDDGKWDDNSVVNSSWSSCLQYVGVACLVRTCFWWRLEFRVQVDHNCVTSTVVLKAPTCWFLQKEKKVGGRGGFLHCGVEGTNL